MCISLQFVNTVSIAKHLHVYKCIISALDAMQQFLQPVMRQFSFMARKGRSATSSFHKGRGLKAVYG